MVRFSVHDEPADGARLLNLPADSLGWQGTQILAPLASVDHVPPPTKPLNPVLSVDSVDCVTHTLSVTGGPISVPGGGFSNLPGAKDEKAHTLHSMIQMLENVDLAPDEIERNAQRGELKAIREPLDKITDQGHR